MMLPTTFRIPKQNLRSGNAGSSTASSPQAPTKSAKNCGNARIFASAFQEVVPTTQGSRIFLVLQWLMPVLATKTKAASIIRFMTIFTGTRTLATRTLFTATLSQFNGSIIMRLADADLLPFDFSDFADTVQTYVKGLQTFSTKMRDDIRERNLEIEEGVFTATADPKKAYFPPKKEDLPPYLDFSPLQNSADALTRSAGEYQKALAAANANGGSALTAASIADVNGLLIQSERKLTSPEGLPGRFWYKHQIYAPGVYTGYESKAIPAVREAIEQKKWQQAEQAMARAAAVLQDEATLVSSAAAKLSAASAAAK